MLRRGHRMSLMLARTTHHPDVAGANWKASRGAELHKHLQVAHVQFCRSGPQAMLVQPQCEFGGAQLLLQRDCEWCPLSMRRASAGTGAAHAAGLVPAPITHVRDGAGTQKSPWPSLVKQMHPET